MVLLLKCGMAEMLLVIISVADPHSICQVNTDATHDALKHGNLRVVKLLIQHGLILNNNRKNMKNVFLLTMATMLFFVCQRGYLDRSKLLTNEAEYTFDLYDYYAPQQKSYVLHITCTQGHHESTKYLLDELEFLEKNTSNGVSPISCAANGDVEIMKLIIIQL